MCGRWNSLILLWTIEHTTNTCQIQCHVSPIMGFIRHTKYTFCMPDEARDGRNVALNLTSVHGVLDCPKKNQAILYQLFALQHHCAPFLPMHALSHK